MRVLKQVLLMAVVAVLAACGDDDAPYEGPSHGTGILKSNAHVLSATQAAGSTLTPNTLIVRKPQSRRFSPGEVVILDAHEGRLLKITSVSETADTIVYQYTLASLAQAFEKLEVSFDGELTPQELGATIETGDPSLEVTWIPRQGPSARAGERTSQQVSAQTHALQIKYKKFAGQVGSGIELDGTSSFFVNPDFSLRLEPVPGQSIPSLEMDAVVAPELQTSVSVSSLYGGQVAFVVDKDIELPAFKRIIIVPILGVPTPVPFWVKPVVTLSGEVSGTAGSKFTTTQKYGVSGALGFRRSVARGLEPVASYSTTSEVIVSDVESEFGINMTVPKVEIHFQIYSVAGPNFDLGLEVGLTGKSAIEGSPPVEGVRVTMAAKLVGNAGLKAALDFEKINIDAVKALLGDVSIEYTPFSLRLVEWTLASDSWFFPYKGVAAVSVFDDGSVPDDIFEISLDGVVLGRTNKGGSGQFRLKDLRPGVRVLRITTVEDDSPPGTFAISLGEELTFEWGGTYWSDTAELGMSKQFNIVVPAVP